MDLFLTWLLVVSIQLAAVMSPGPAFFFTISNATKYSRRIGIWACLGLALGVLMHVSLVLTGLSYLVSESIFLFNLIKYVGAAYLFYLGVKVLLSIKKGQNLDQDILNAEKPKQQITAHKAIFLGFLANALNPKAVLFFTAFFTQFIDPTTPFFVKCIYGMISVCFEFLWFSGVVVFLTNTQIRAKFMSVMHWVDGVCGGLMIALGVKLALSK